MKMLKKPTPEEAVELRQWAEEVVAMWYDRFQELKPELPGWGMKIAKLSMLPKNELWKKFYDTIIVPDINNKCSEEEWRLFGMIKSGKNDFIIRHHLDEFQSKHVVYKIIGRKVLPNKWTGEKDEIIQIGIPYEMDWKPEFAGSIIVSKIKAPRVFQGCLEKYEWYNGETEFSFLSWK